MRILILFLLCFCTQAQVPQAKREILNDLGPEGETPQKVWKLKLSHINGYAHIDLYKKKSKKAQLSYTADLVTHVFNHAYITVFQKKKYLITLWNSGSHGEEVFIFDLNYKVAKPVWFYVSSWPVKLVISKKEITIKGSGDMDETTGIPKEQIKKWNPSMKPMDLSLDSEASLP